MNINSGNDEIETRYWHSMSVVQKNADDFSAYFIGGKSDGGKSLKSLLKLEITSKAKRYFLLHYLRETGIQLLVGLNMI